ncbi:hypothetical protein KDE36_23840, partial [Pseudomonas aeruginosa]
WISGLGILLSENQGRLPRESAMNQKKGHYQAGGGLVMACTRDICQALGIWRKRRYQGGI